MTIAPELVSRIALFQHIDVNDIEDVLCCVHAASEQHKKGSFIRIAGDPADFIGIVLSGTVQVLLDGYDGRRNITSAFGPGALFAEAFSCAGVDELPVSIMAAENCEILTIKIDQILSVQKDECGFHHILMRNLLHILAQKNMLLNRKLSCVSHKTTAEKLMAFLNDQAQQHHSIEFTIPYDRQALADYLGVDRSAMSTELSKLQRQGMLETKGNRFRLCR